MIKREIVERGGKTFVVSTVVLEESPLPTPPPPDEDTDNTGTDDTESPESEEGS